MKNTVKIIELFHIVDNIRADITEGETLGIKQIELLLVLLKHKNLSISDIAKQMGVMPSSISGLTDKLLKKGLIHRTYNHIDRRVVTVNLTEKGILLARDLENKQEKILSKMESGLTKEEIHIFNNLLEKINGL
jgi:MarR family transcriptional regulator, organic hydroperoxide resistance regulator